MCTRTTRKAARKLKGWEGESVNITKKAPSLSATVPSLDGRSDRFCVDGVVNGKSRSIILDAGTTITILSPNLASDGDVVRPSSWTLKTVTRDYAEVYRETVATFLIGDTSFKLRML